MTKRYDLKNIRNLLAAGFSGEELRDLCHYETDFKPVYDQLPLNPSKADIINLLIKYAQQTSRFESLLTLAKAHNPVQYEKHQPYYEATAISPTAEDVHLEAAKTEFSGHLSSTLTPSEIITGDKVAGDEITITGDQVAGDKSTVAGDQIAGDKKNFIQIGTLMIPMIPMLFIAVGILGVLSFVSYRTFVPASLPTPTAVSGPTQMTGLFNVVVAEFGEIDPAGQLHPSTGGQQLSQWIYEGLRLEFENLPTDLRQEFLPLVWHDSLAPQEKGVEIGLVAGDEAAAELAQKIKADMVIYGNLELNQDSAGFTPKFYVASLRGEADEIVGRHQLGRPIDIQTPLNLDQQTSRALNRKLIARTKALSRFTLGLIYDLNGLSEDALEVFQQATEELDWDDNSGEEIFHYFTGRSALFLERDEEAQAAFEQALAINPDYARAYLGVGSVYFLRAQQLPPEQRLETTDLFRAIDHYQKAIALADEALEPHTKVSAHLGLGLTYRLQGETYLHVGDRDRAGPLFDMAIAEIQPLIDPMQTARQYRYLGQAYQTLGAAYAQQAYIHQVHGDKTGSITLYEKARQAHANCAAQGDKAPNDEILTQKIIANGCNRQDGVVQEALTNLEGEP